MEGDILAHRADVALDPEQHVVGGKLDRLLAVDADLGVQRVEVDVGFDPRPHRLEGIGVLGAPEGPVAFLPGTLADVVADGVAEDAGKCVFLR
jgi:hypothetical protein